MNYPYTDETRAMLSWIATLQPEPAVRRKRLTSDSVIPSNLAAKLQILLMHYTQRKIAATVGISQTAVWNAMRGVPVRQSTIHALRAALRALPITKPLPE